MPTIKNLKRAEYFLNVENDYFCKKIKHGLE